jgi:hypothetical protein
MRLLFGAAVVAAVLCHDFTRDGRTDIAVTIASGGRFTVARSWHTRAFHP